ncbi:MAG: MarR family transcriptional regulator [Planctomycetes bacterium]|nr:MarR family transcriptional regulator [Planctomycetota bacterium]
MKQSLRANGYAVAKRPLNGEATTATLSRTPSSPPQAEALVASLRAIVRDMFIVDDAASDLPLRQLRVCMILAAGPQSMSALSRELGVSLSATTQIADRLVAAGLAQRLPEGADRRVRCLQLTPRGRQIMERRDRIKVRRAQAALHRMRPADSKKLMSALAALQSACEESRLP